MNFVFFAFIVVGKLESMTCVAKAYTSFLLWLTIFLSSEVKNGVAKPTDDLTESEQQERPMVS